MSASELAIVVPMAGIALAIRHWWYSDLDLGTVAEGVVVARTVDGKYSPAKTANAGIRGNADHADVIIKTDCDCKMHPDLIQMMGEIKQGTVILPKCTMIDEQYRKTRDDCVCGTVAMTSHDWKLVRGFDERMYGHGYEDGDLWFRCRNLGLKVERPEGMLTHYWHPSRISEYYPRRRDENIIIQRDQGLWHEQPESENWGMG